MSRDAEPAAEPSGGDAVVLTIPASSAYLALARAATAGMCARADFSLERIEDVTLAVDEAISLLLLDVVPGTDITCRWQPVSDGILVEITSVSSSGRAPRSATFAWTVLSALVHRATAEAHEGLVTVALRATRESLAVS